MSFSPPPTPSSPLPTFNDSPSPTFPLASSKSSRTAGAVDSIPTALARFEYEAGHTAIATGTKVLLVEWEDSNAVRGRAGVWVVEWKGRREVLIAEEDGTTNADADDVDVEIARADGTDPVEASRPSGDTSQGTKSGKHRLYFLLQPGAAVPAHVSITFRPAPTSSSEGYSTTATSKVATASPTKRQASSMPALAPQPMAHTSIPTLPAIFPPPLCTSATMHSKKGVLHTLWAKSRLNALSAEIAHEEATNIEGIGLDMAQGELGWICENFGVGPRAAAPDSAMLENEPVQANTASSPTKTGASPQRPLSTRPFSPTSPQPPPPPPTPASPNTVLSSERFLSKMKGLRVGTSPTASTSSDNKASLAQALHRPDVQGMPTPPQTEGSGGAFLAGRNPLSPEAGDVAVGGFEALKGARGGGAMGSEERQIQAKTAVVVPPAAIMVREMGRQGGFSMDEIARGQIGMGTRRDVKEEVGGEDAEDDEGLFALPMSPQSPESRTSPFSFDRVATGGR